MKDYFSLVDYLGPGVYLLYNCAQEIGTLIAEKGYKVCSCKNASLFRYIIDENDVDYIIINDIGSNFDEYTNLIMLSQGSSVKKIVINTLIYKNQCNQYYKFIEESFHSGYSIDSGFSLLNPNYDASFQCDQSIKILLNYSDKKLKSPIDKMGHNAIFEKKTINYLPFVRPGDRILILSQSVELMEPLKRIFLEQTKSSLVQTCLLENIALFPHEKQSYHFILIDVTINPNSINLFSRITHSLLPAGRCIISKPSQELVQELASLNIQPEVYFIYENGDLKGQIHNGEEIKIIPELCVFMKNPSDNTDFPYEESIYGYSNPPANLLAFARDYDNPWLVRGIVEFPFRNRSAFHLKQYSLQILECYDPIRPDYAAALAVLGYQLLSQGIDPDNILNKISTYCSNISAIANPTPHQYRWYISLSTLLGLIYNKNNDKINALINFSRAANANFEKFSPSIGTKILQSSYLNATILISLKKASCAEIIINKGIKKGMKLLNQDPEELIGKASRPLNFTLYIYHDIIDWIIKLVNIKNSISDRKFNIANHDNNNTWSNLLRERMSAIDSMSFIINERDSTIRSQKVLIDERDNTIHIQNNLIEELDETINFQNKLIEELQKKIVS